MSQIQDLNPGQWAKVPVYLNKWLAVGKRTATVDRDKAKSAVHFLYEKILKIDKPKFTIFLDSPMACQLAANLMNNGNQLDNQLSDQLSVQLGSQLGSQLWNQLGNQLSVQLGSQLRSQLCDQLWNQLSDQLSVQLDNQLRNQLWNQLSVQLGDQLYDQKLQYLSYAPTLWLWPGWAGFYDFLLNEVFQEKQNDFLLFSELCQHWQQVHYYLLFPQISFISDFPREINLNGVRLHHETQGALVYRDNYAIHALNGIRVPAWAIETPKDEIDPKKVLELTSTEQRSAIMRHIGLAKFLKDLNAEEIDSLKEYRLYYLNVENQKIGPYLYMTCPSSGRKFLEGVGDSQKYESIDPTIKTVKDALHWRATRASQNLMTKFNLNWQYSS